MDPVIRRSDSIAHLAAALSKAQGEIENATKNAENPHYRSSYADLAEIINTVRPVLTRHGLSWVQLPGFADGIVSVETTLMHESGEWLTGISGAPIPKADPQGVGSATTYLRRYSLAALCGIAQEDDDGEAASRPARENGHHEKPAKAFSLDSPAMGKKHKGKTWREVVATDPEYVAWACDNMETLPTEAKLALRDAMRPAEPSPALLRAQVTELLETARTLGAVSESQQADTLSWLDEGHPDDKVAEAMEKLRLRIEAKKMGNGGRAKTTEPQGDLIGAGR